VLVCVCECARVCESTCEYAERIIEYSLLFICSPFYEYSHLEYEHVPVSYRVHQAEYVLHFCMAASQEYVYTYSTCRCASARAQAAESAGVSSRV